MTTRGPAYARTYWSYGERPVTAAKLNAWDGHIADALELAWLLLNQAFGGGNGVVPGLAQSLHVVAATPPGLSVRVLPGAAFIGASPFRLDQAVDTIAVSVPQTDPRVDLVQARLDDWSIEVCEGVEAPAPLPPVPGAHCLALAALHLRPAMTGIKNTDDGVNGYIEDLRVVLGP